MGERTEMMAAIADGTRIAHEQRVEIDRLQVMLDIALPVLCAVAAERVHEGQNNVAMQALAAIDELRLEAHEDGLRKLDAFLDRTRNPPHRDPMNVRIGEDGPVMLEPDGPSPEGPPWAKYGPPDEHHFRKCVCGRVQPECVCVPPFSLGDLVVTWWADAWTKPMLVADIRPDHNWLTLIGIGSDGSKITTRPWICRLACPKDAAESALDEIAALCGCPRWEYPGQVVRDVAALLSEQLYSDLVKLKTVLPVCIESLRDIYREGSEAMAELADGALRIADPDHEPMPRPTDIRADFEIIPQYRAQFASADEPTRCVVRHKFGLFLRYSKGPRQGHMFDVYGDDYLNVELAEEAIAMVLHCGSGNSGWWPVEPGRCELRPTRFARKKEPNDATEV